MGLSYLLFSFQGRISRLQFFAGAVMYFLLFQLPIKASMAYSAYKATKGAKELEALLASPATKDETINEYISAMNYLKSYESTFSWIGLVFIAIGLIYVVMSIFSFFAVMVKRMHDFNVGGMNAFLIFMLTAFAPFIVFYALSSIAPNSSDLAFKYCKQVMWLLPLALLIAPGSKFPNNFGERNHN